MTALEEAVTGAFGRSGALARADAGHVERDVQLRMALGVAQAIEERSALVVEAGTGVGKTFAYLVPTLLSGARALVSTATKSLQDQLFLRDIPRLREALKLPVTVALLKGRASYLCLHRLDQGLIRHGLGQAPDLPVGSAVFINNLGATRAADAPAQKIRTLDRVKRGLKTHFIPFAGLFLDCSIMPVASQCAVPQDLRQSPWPMRAPPQRSVSPLGNTFSRPCRWAVRPKVPQADPSRTATFRAAHRPPRPCAPHWGPGR